MSTFTSFFKVLDCRSRQSTLQNNVLQNIYFCKYLSMTTSEFHILLKFLSGILFVSLQQKFSANVATGLHLHPHLHQAVLLILPYGVESLSSSQLFSSSGLKNSLVRCHIEWFQCVYWFDLFFDI